MGKETVIAKNITREGPGLIEEVLQARGFPYKVIDLTTGETIPPPDSFDILIIMGGPDSANDTTEKMRAEITAIKQALAANKHYLGICLGLQTLVKAGGGKVVAGRVKEIGFRDQKGGFNEIDLTDEGRNDPLFKGLGERFRVFHLHGETVELTEDMELLGKGGDVKNQIVKIGDNSYGIQCHFELTAEMLEKWLEEDSDLQGADHDQIREDFQKLEEEYTQVGKQLVNNFLDIVESSS